RFGAGLTSDDAVSAGSLAGRNTEQFHWYDLVIKHRHQPPHWTHEDFPALAPIHIFGPVERGDFPGKSFGKNLGGGAAFALNGGRQVFTPGSADFFELRDVDSNFLGKGVRCRSRLAILIRDLRRRPVELLSNIRLGSRNAGSYQRQAAR